MNTLSLSVSNPSKSNGMSLRRPVRTAFTSVRSRNSNGAHSVHPVAISVRTRVWAKLPRAEGPLCDTRSASTNPGAGSCQSECVRTGMLCRTDDGEIRGRRRRAPDCSRMLRRDRSIVAALMASKPARTSSARARWPCLSMEPTSVGSNGFRRLPQMRSDASHNTTRASRTASSYRRRDSRAAPARRADEPPRNNRMACFR